MIIKIALLTLEFKDELNIPLHYPSQSAVFEIGMGQFKRRKFSFVFIVTADSIVVWQAAHWKNSYLDQLIEKSPPPFLKILQNTIWAIFQFMRFEKYLRIAKNKNKKTWGVTMFCWSSYWLGDQEVHGSHLVDSWKFFPIDLGIINTLLIYFSCLWLLYVIPFSNSNSHIPCD